MKNVNDHKEFSQMFVQALDEDRKAGKVGTWENQFVSLPIPGHPNYSIVAWGELTKSGTPGFSVSLCHKVNGEGDGYFKAYFTAFSPSYESYTGISNVVEKLLEHFDRSFHETAAPIHTVDIYSQLSEDDMKPLMDALNDGNFELAAQLAPANYRLCGYKEYPSAFLHESLSLGKAAEFIKTVVPAGRYPVFVENYDFVEKDNQFSNDIKDAQGVAIYMSGDKVKAGSQDLRNITDKRNVIWERPYCHVIAEEIAKGNSSIHLLPSFKVEPVHFLYEGVDRTTYKIVDQGLPPRMKGNPFILREQNRYINKTYDLSDRARKLFDDFVADYCYSLVGWSNPYKQIYDLTTSKVYSASVLQELMDKNLIQSRDSRGGAFELTAHERLHLLHSGQMHFADRVPSNWMKELERCKSEINHSHSLNEKINTASHVAAENSPRSEKKERDTVSR